MDFGGIIRIYVVVCGEMDIQLLDIKMNFTGC